MYEIKTLNKIATCGTDIFDKAKYTVSDNAENPTAIMVRSAKMHDMEMPESLLAIARAGAGVNNIPVEKCQSRESLYSTHLAQTQTLLRSLLFVRFFFLQER